METTARICSGVQILAIMQRKITVITGTRAEYGLLKILLKKIIASPSLALSLIVTGSHLSPAFGSSYKQIEEDGFVINHKVDMLVSADSPSAVAKSIGLAIISFTQIFQESKPDVILFLGDRVELLGAATAAIPFNIVLAHIAGGEITEGAVDEQIRHSLTKMSHIHFPCSSFYADNIRDLAEEEWRIHNVGHPCLELIKTMELVPKSILFNTYDLDISKKLFLVTLHPTTLNTLEKEKEGAHAFFTVLSKYTDVNILITAPNSDTNYHVIEEEIDKIKYLSNVRVVANLGSLYYLSVMKIADAVIGNSSSGLVEGPYFRVPIINYGDRQKGRLSAYNIIDTVATEEALDEAIRKALFDKEFIDNLSQAESIYGEGTTSDDIVHVLETVALDDNILRKKFIKRCKC
jgi:UDP-hydrolysing UDP-N-acetyl-D-glucosamine 2-epimerase